MMRLVNLLLITLFLVGCERESDKQWEHSLHSSYASAYSPNGKYVLVGDTDSAARLWDLEANKVLYNWQNNKEVSTTTAVGFSADGKVAATSEQDVIVLWEVATGEPMMRLSFPVKIKALALSAHGDYILLALHDRTAVYFDVIQNRVVRVFEHDGKNVNSPVNQLINAVALSPSGKYALTGSDDRTARLWRLETGEQLRSWKHENAVNIVSFYPKGGYVLTGAENGQAHFWNMKSGKEKYVLRTSSLWPEDLPLPDFPTFKTSISAIDFSSDGKYLATGHTSRMLCMWSVAKGKKIACWQVAMKNALRPGVVLQAVAFSPDGKSLYSESGNGIGQKWKIK